MVEVWDPSHSPVNQDTFMIGSEKVFAKFGRFGGGRNVRTWTWFWTKRPDEPGKYYFWGVRSTKTFDEAVQEFKRSRVGRSLEKIGSPATWDKVSKPVDLSFIGGPKEARLTA